MPSEAINNHSKIHGDLEARVSELERTNEKQWKKIDRIQWGIVLTLVAIIGNLVVLIVK